MNRLNPKGAIRMKVFLVFTLLLLFASAARAQHEAAAQLADIRAYLPISDHLATSGQPADADFALIRDAGYDLVVNLAPPADMHAQEGFFVTSTGMSYVQIPVNWKAPSLDHLEQFFGVMEAHRDKKVWVHCFANMRVSAFVYLYRTLREGVPEAEARAMLHEIWEPQEAWPAFIEKAQQRYEAPRIEDRG